MRQCKKQVGMRNPQPGPQALHRFRPQTGADAGDGLRVQLFVLSRFYPCGEKAACCGPVGQPWEELARYSDAATAAGADHVAIKEVELVKGNQQK